MGWKFDIMWEQHFQNGISIPTTLFTTSDSRNYCSMLRAEVKMNRMLPGVRSTTSTRGSRTS